MYRNVTAEPQAPTVVSNLPKNSIGYVVLVRSPTTGLEGPCECVGFAAKPAWADNRIIQTPYTFSWPNVAKAQPDRGRIKVQSYWRRVQAAPITPTSMTRRAGTAPTGIAPLLLVFGVGRSSNNRDSRKTAIHTNNWSNMPFGNDGSPKSSVGDPSSLVTPAAVSNVFSILLTPDTDPSPPTPS